MSYNFNKSRLPIQKLPLSKKTQEWREANVDYYVSKEGSDFKGGLSKGHRKKLLYDLWNSKYDLNDLKYVTNPYSVDDGFPAQPQNFNIIRPKIELLIGEESKRPFNLRVIKTGMEGYNEIQEKYKEMLFEYIMSQIEQPEQVEGEEPPPTPQQIQDYMKYSYSDIAEKKANYTLKYLHEKLNLNNEFLKGWKDALIAGEEVYYVGIINGEPVIERVNPLNMTYDNSPDLEFIEDGEWAVRHMYMTPTGIYDRFYDIMKESDLDKVLDLAGQESVAGTGSSVNYDKIVYRQTDAHLTSSNSGSDNYIDVWHVTWKSFKRIGFYTSVDEEGGSETNIVDETFSLLPADKANGSTLEWEWVTEVWEGYKIGDDIYLGIAPTQNQMISADNPNSSKLPYTGAIYNNSNTEGLSLVELMKPLQYMYIIIWYRLELALSRDKGKVINMDITQIPKSMGVDVNKWMHMITALGVNLFNPYEEGWDIPGREGGKPAQFNQMSAQDLTMANVIVQYVELMNKIEDMIGELSGVSKQRQGSINTHELVGNVERSVIQSSHITEPYFWVHNQVKKNTISMLLNTAKTAWSDRPDTIKLNYIFDDTTRICLDLGDDFLYSDYSIFVTDSSDEARKIEQLQSLYQPAMQNGATLGDIATLMTMNNLTEIKKKLQEIEEKRMQQMQQQQQQEQEMMQQKSEMEAQIRGEENRIKEEDSIRRSETSIEVAMINAEARINSMSQIEDTGMHDESEEQILRDRMEIDRDKNNREIELKRAAIEETIRKNRKAEELKEREIAIKKQQKASVNKSK